MSAFDYNPDTCLEVLHKTAEEIPSGVSEVDVQNISKNTEFTKSLICDSNNEIVSSLKQGINKVWEIYQIPKVLGCLKELQHNKDNFTDRPYETESANVNCIKAKYLLKLRDELKKNIEDLKEEKLTVINNLNEVTEALENQIKFPKTIC